MARSAGASPVKRASVRSLLNRAGTLAGADLGKVPDLQETAEAVFLDRGDVLVTAGDESDDVFALVKGRLEVVAPSEDGAAERHLIDMLPGSFVGEVALLAGGRRTTTVRAATKAELVRIPAGAFTALMESNRPFAERMQQEAARRLRRSEFAQHIVELLGDHDAELISELEEAVTWEHLPAGKILFEIGDLGDAAFLLISGRLRVTNEYGEQIASDVTAGEMVGEVALLEGTPRTATVAAVRDAELARLPKSILDRLFESHPRLGLQLARIILRRNVAPQLRRAPDTHVGIAVVPATDGIDLRLFCARLADALKPHGETMHLWSARVDSMLDRPAIAQALAHEPGGVRLNTWLHELDHRFRFVLFEVERDDSEWTKRAVARADVVLIVGEASKDPTPGGVEQRLTDMIGATPARRTTLVLLQDGSDLPSGTERWLEPRTVLDHHHVRMGSMDDMERLGRVLSGRANGLVLSGGGARGFAHLGVIRSLHELDFPIDMVCGSSMGAVIAVGPARNLSISEMHAEVRKQFRNLLDYTIPAVSMIKGERILRALNQGLGDMRIEDLWNTYFCMSTNLTRSLSVVHSRGHLATALRASFAIPGVLPPVPHEGDLLVDGGVLNNLPLDEMRKINPSGTVIAVDVAPRRGPRAKGDFGLAVSGSRALLGRFRPGSPVAAPGIVSVLLRSMIVGALRDRDKHERDGLADLYLDLDLRGTDLLDFDAVERVATAGYEAAAPRIEEWLETRDGAEA